MDAVDHDPGSFSQLLVLHSSVLEPDLHLSLCQVQLTGQMPAFLARNVTVVDELTFEHEGLKATVGLPFLALSGGTLPSTGL